MDRSALGEICFEFVGGLPAGGPVGVDDLDRFLEHVREVVGLYREVVVSPPAGLTTDQALRAVTSVGSRRILAYSGGREGLDALVVRRHEVLSSAGAVSLGDLRAATLAVRRRFGVGAGPGESVELAGAVLKRLFPAGVGVVGAEGAAGASSGSVVDRLMPGVPWTGVSAMSEVVGALGEAGRGAVVVLWAQEVQAAQDDMGEFTLFVRLDPDPGDGQMRIALVDPRAVPPVEALPEREWAGVSGQSRTWVDTGVETRMIVLDGTGWPAATAIAPVLSRSSAAWAVAAASHGRPDTQTSPAETQPTPQDTLARPVSPAPAVRPYASDTTETLATGALHMMGNADTQPMSFHEDAAGGMAAGANVGADVVLLKVADAASTRPTAFLDASPRKSGPGGPQHVLLSSPAHTDPVHTPSREVVDGHVVAEARAELVRLSGDRAAAGAFSATAIEITAIRLSQQHRFANSRALGQATAQALVNSNPAVILGAGTRRNATTSPHAGNDIRHTDEQTDDADRREGSSRPAAATRNAEPPLSPHDQHLAHTLDYIQRRGVRPPLTIDNHNSDSHRALEELVNTVNDALHNNPNPNLAAANTAITEFQESTARASAHSRSTAAGRHQQPVPVLWEENGQRFVLGPSALKSATEELRQQVEEIAVTLHASPQQKESGATDHVGLAHADPIEVVADESVTSDGPLHSQYLNDQSPVWVPAAPQPTGILSFRAFLDVPREARVTRTQGGHVPGAMQEIQRLMVSGTDEFGIEFNSEAGVDALFADNPDLPVSERSKIQAKAWDANSLKEFFAACRYFAPILGRRRAESNMGKIPQGVILVGRVTCGVLAGLADPRVKGEYFEKSRLINYYESDDMEYSTNERFHDIVHELAHALFPKGPFENKFWKGVEAPPVSGDGRVVQNRTQDLFWSLIPYLVNDEEFQEEYPRRNQALKMLERNHRHLFVRVGRETLEEGAGRITAALSHAVPWFGEQVGAWTSDGSRYYPMGPPLNEYGGTHSREDLAESVAYFFTNVKLLEEKSPERAAHISEEVNSWTSGGPLRTTHAAASGRGQAGLKVTSSKVRTDMPANSGLAHPHPSAAVDAFRPNPVSPGRVTGTHQARETGKSVSDTRRASFPQDRDDVTDAETAVDGIKTAVEGQILVPGRWDARAEMFVLDPDLLSPVNSVLARQAARVWQMRTDGYPVGRTALKKGVTRVGFAGAGPEQTRQLMPRALKFASGLARHLGSVSVVLPNGQSISVCPES